MAALSKKRLNPIVRNEIVRDLVTHIYGSVENPSPTFITKVGEMLVEKYPFMADSKSSESEPYVSMCCNMTSFWGVWSETNLILCGEALQ